MRRLGPLLMAIGLAAGLSAASAEDVLTIGTGDYPPFTDSAAPDGGSVNRVVREMADAAGFEVAFEYLPWMRALELTRDGRFTATSFWYFKEERNADFIHVGPIFEDRLVFFRLIDTEEPEWTTLEDLRPLTIGAVTGYTYTPDLWRLAEEGVLSVETAQSDEANLRKLLAGRIDLFPMSAESGRVLIERLFSEQDRNRITVVERPLVVTEGYLLVSRKAANATEIAERLQSALDGRELSGR